MKFIYSIKTYFKAWWKKHVADIYPFEGEM